MREYGLVLAGGGAKGAYQIGAWKALREMGITFSAITGVSIGAINGALIASGDFDKALELWSNVEVASGINIPFELKEPKNLFSISNL
ncbi:MAG: patatin-like phospholipase family protein, partial [Oscillospiraceae bacterium]